MTAKCRGCIALLYLPAKIIPRAILNTLSTQQLVICTRNYGMIKRDAAAKKFLFTLRVSVAVQRRQIFEARCFATQARLYRKPIGLHGCSIIATALFRTDGIRERVVQTVRAAGLKRLSAILRSCLEERRQILSFSPENPRRKSC